MGGGGKFPSVITMLYKKQNFSRYILRFGDFITTKNAKKNYSIDFPNYTILWGEISLGAESGLAGNQLFRRNSVVQWLVDTTYGKTYHILSEGEISI